MKEVPRPSISELLKQLRQATAKLPGGKPLDPPELPNIPVKRPPIVDKRTPDEIKVDNFLKEQQISLADFLGLFATCIWNVLDWDWSLPKKSPEEPTKKK